MSTARRREWGVDRRKDGRLFVILRGMERRAQMGLCAELLVVIRLETDFSWRLKREPAIFRSPAPPRMLTVNEWFIVYVDLTYSTDVRTFIKFAFFHV